MTLDDHKNHPWRYPSYKEKEIYRCCHTTSCLNAITKVCVQCSGWASCDEHIPTNLSTTLTQEISNLKSELLKAQQYITALEKELQERAYSLDGRRSAFLMLLKLKTNKDLELQPKANLNNID